MISIRRNVFETNSSSTHSICICTEDDYEKWKNGEKLWDYWSDELVDIDEVSEEDRDTYDFRSYDFENEYLEWYEHHFVTPSGDKMVAFGLYGRDG